MIAIKSEQKKQINNKREIKEELFMSVFSWDKLEKTMITPGKTNSRGETVRGKRLLLQRILHDKDRGDGKGAGAQPHAHPEEQIFVALEGLMKMRIGKDWYTLEPGDVALVPPYVEHEEICDDDFLWYNIKSRVPGHSWYDTSWKPGSEEDWGKLEKIYDELDEKYVENDPWPPKDQMVYTWDKLEETKITPSRTPARGKSIKGKFLVFNKILYSEDRGDGQGAGAQPHSHPEEQLIIPLKGTLKMRMAEDWFEVGPGDIVLVPAETEHEQIVEGELLWFNIKNRIPGHSIYDGSWNKDSKEAWAEYIKLYNEMDKNYQETTPWNE